MPSKPISKSPFKDKIGSDTFGYRGQGNKTYDSEKGVNLPQREGGLLPEVYRDNVAKDPSLKGPIKTPFKDAVS